MMSPAILAFNRLVMGMDSVERAILDVDGDIVAAASTLVCTVSIPALAQFGTLGLGGCTCPGSL